LEEDKIKALDLAEETITRAINAETALHGPIRPLTDADHANIVAHLSPELDPIGPLPNRNSVFMALVQTRNTLSISEDRLARLEGALVEHNDLLRSALSIAKREGVDGEIASTNWDAYYNRVAVVLKRHHQTANDARAALTDGGKDG
jgi:hypothetical protein